MYKYEMHCHTSEGSRCAGNMASEMVDFYKEQGYTGIIITDHFFNGNCTVPKDLPWQDRVELYCKGFKNAKIRGNEVGLDVFFGWEFGGDFITLGLSEEWLKNHENIDLLSPIDYFELIHSVGGYIIHAHPFRERPYIKSIRLYPRYVDAIETINSGNSDFENSIADYFAEQYSITKVCGSDKHDTVPNKLASLELDFKANTIDEIIEAVKSNNHTISQYI